MSNTRHQGSTSSHNPLGGNEFRASSNHQHLLLLYATTKPIFNHTRISAAATSCLHITAVAAAPILRSMTGFTANDGHPFSFVGKKAVVIAGSAGIGKGIAELIAQLGGQVRWN